jgi:transcriptional regulator with XRE-family HTH domain
MDNIEDKSNNISLGDFCRKSRSMQGLSADDVARRSRGEITKSYVIQIETDAEINPTVKKLKALAKGLGESEELIFRLARGISHHSFAFEYQELLNDLITMERWSEENRIDALYLMRAIIKAVHEKEKRQKTENPQPE